MSESAKAIGRRPSPGSHPPAKGAAHGRPRSSPHHARNRRRARPQPEEEYERILHALGREPNLVELGIFSVMWSEHCSYKARAST